VVGPVSGLPSWLGQMAPCDPRRQSVYYCHHSPLLLLRSGRQTCMHAGKSVMARPLVHCGEWSPKLAPDNGCHAHGGADRLIRELPAAGTAIGVPERPDPGTRQPQRLIFKTREGCPFFFRNRETKKNSPGHPLTGMQGLDPVITSLAKLRHGAHLTLSVVSWQVSQELFTAVLEGQRRSKWRWCGSEGHVLGTSESSSGSEKNATGLGDGGDGE